jgi:hypothetical protein
VIDQALASRAAQPETGNEKRETTTTRVALKEWAVACETLGRGDQILLLRKGGIREEQREFRVEQTAFFLFPTYEHQREELLKPHAREELLTIAAQHDRLDQVELRYWATVAETFQVTESEQVAAIAPFHLWSDAYALERLRWRPRKPLQVLALRAHRLRTAASLPVLAEYGGCKSWLTLAEPLIVAGAQPVLSDRAFSDQLQAVRRALGRPS